MADKQDDSAHDGCSGSINLQNEDSETDVAANVLASLDEATEAARSTSRNGESNAAGEEEELNTTNSEGSNFVANALEAQDATAKSRMQQSTVGSSNSMAPGAFAVARVLPDQETPRSARNASAVESETGMSEGNSSPVVERSTPLVQESTTTLPSNARKRANNMSSSTRADVRSEDIQPPEDLSEFYSISSAPVEAELVTPPVEALQVCIDEECDAAISSPASNIIYPLDVEQARSQFSSESKWARCHPRSWGPTQWIFASILAGLLIGSILTPLAFSLMEEHHNSREETGYNYSCYTSTQEILLDQVTHSNASQPLIFVICPNTMIDVGIFQDPERDDYRFVEGDYPIMVIRPNIAIQCGLDGKKENNCTLNGGFIQVLTMQKIPLPDGSSIMINSTIDNTTIRGITFTGRADASGPFDGLSISLNHPGRNIRFEDCTWTHITSSSGVIGLFRNKYQLLTGLPLDDYTIEAAFSDCIFEHIVYSIPLIYVLAQSVTIDRCIFRDIEVSLLAYDQCSTTHSGTDGDLERGCTNLLHCEGNSTCTMTECCIENVQHKALGLVTANEDSDFDYFGLFAEGVERQCELAVIHELNTTDWECEEIFTEPICLI